MASQSPNHGSGTEVARDRVTDVDEVAADHVHEIADAADRDRIEEADLDRIHALDEADLDRTHATLDVMIVDENANDLEAIHGHEIVSAIHEGQDRVRVHARTPDQGPDR